MESTIGIVSGIIGIIAGLIGIVEFVLWLRKRLKCPAKELFSQLIDKNLTDAEHRKILKWLNKTPLIGNRIKEEYIQSFVLGKRGKETVLFDLCNSNDIEPTDDICKGLIDSHLPYLMERYKEQRQSHKESKLE